MRGFITMNNTILTRKKGINLLFFFLACAISFTFINLARYALPKTDDFASMVYGYLSINQHGSFIKGILMQVKTNYLQQQGAYTASTLALLALTKIGTSTLRYQIVTVFFVACAFTSYLLLAYTVSKHFHFPHIWGIFLFSTLWIAVDLVGPGEAMLYVVGACVYSFPMSLGLFATTCFLHVIDTPEKDKRMKWCILSSLFAVGATGGVLMVAGMVNIFFVCILLYTWFTEKKFPLRGIVPFLFSFGGALLNALAPGNFIRYAGSYGEGAPDVRSSIINTFIIALHHIYNLATKTYLLVALLLVAFFILILPMEQDRNHFRVHPIFLAIAGYICCYTIVFPTVLGYHLMPGDYVEERIVFTFAWVASLLILLTWSYALMWLKIRYLSDLKWTGLSIVLAGIVFCFGVLLSTAYIPHFRQDASVTTLRTIWREHKSGSLKNYYAAYHLTLKQADDTPVGEACYIFYEIPETRLFMKSSMSAQPDWWVNRSVAAVYQLGLFDYCPEHPFTEQDALDAGYTLEQLLP